MLRFAAGLSLLLLALLSESVLAAAGWRFAAALAVLIAFAYVFDFWELAVFDLLAVFALNWEPAIGGSIIAFAALPLAAYVVRRLIPAEPLFAAPAGIVAGFLLFYAVSAPAYAAGHSLRIFADIVIGLMVGELAVLCMA